MATSTLGLIIAGEIPVVTGTLLVSAQRSIRQQRREAARRERRQQRNIRRQFKALHDDAEVQNDALSNHSRALSILVDRLRPMGDEITGLRHGQDSLKEAVTGLTTIVDDHNRYIEREQARTLGATP